MVQGSGLLVEMSQNAVVPAGFTEIGWRPGGHRRLSPLRGVGGAVSGCLEDREEEMLVGGAVKTSCSC